MPPLLIAYPAIDPVLVSLGPLPIRWYALAYIGGLVGGWAAARFLVSRPPLWGGRPHATPLAIDDLVVYIAAGIILGGRIGYILFYNLPFYLAHPLRDADRLEGAAWPFTAASIGTAIAMALFARRYRRAALPASPTPSPPSVPIGLCLGRLANFIKPELWGRVTTVPWAMIFPGSDGRAPASEPALRGRAGGRCPVHPPLAASSRPAACKRDGLVVGLFCVLGYGIGPHRLRIFSRAGPAAGLSLRQCDHGHASLRCR